MNAERHAGEALAFAAELRAVFETRFGHELSERQSAQLLLNADPTLRQDYLALLRTLPAESSLVQGVVRELMNKESYFFRDATSVASLREHVLPELIAAAAPARVLRVWSAGCSTGEELYTLSILLHELIPDLDTWSIALVGTDIDAAAIGHAKLAQYKEWSLRAATADQRSCYFEHLPHWGRYQLRAHYLRDTSFALHNLADPQAMLPAPGRFDLILCRNVSIYFSRAARDVLARKLTSALAPGGVLIHGPSDPRPELELTTRVLPGLLEYRRPAAAAPAAPEPLASVDASARHVERRPAAGPLVLAAGAALEPATAKTPWTERKRAAQAQVDHLALARAHADREETESALQLVDQVIAADPLLAEAYLLRALLFAPDDPRAIEDLRRVIYLEPWSLEAHLRLGLRLERLGDRRAAIAAYRNAAASSVPGHSPTGHVEMQRMAARRMTDLLAEEDHEER